MLCHHFINLKGKPWDFDRHYGDVCVEEGGGVGGGKVEGAYRESPVTLTPGAMTRRTRDDLVGSPHFLTWRSGKQAKPGLGRTYGTT